MKKIHIDEQWCLGCHLCEYYCAFANSGKNDMSKLQGAVIRPRVRVEEQDGISFAVNCRHCHEPLCLKSCIAGAITRGADGFISIDKEKCVGCYTCVLVCPFGAVAPAEDGVAQKCELCLSSAAGAPACVLGCPNRAIVYEEERE
ncbi:MAG: 4Fe-4S binding protein [Clostridiales bacterium]|jgi:carbon-monoxide dehydrogenase iron sulfur subunit|nr:4Fe-4S binding protein [Clostridiales bacterium]